MQLDGDWYHVDVTFDGSANGVPSYSYFNVPDSMKDDGSWPWDHSQIPAANGTKYCYLYTNAAVVEDFYGIPAVLREKIDNRERVATFILKDNKGFTRDVANYIANGMLVGDGYLYFDNAYALQGQVVYKFNIEYNENVVTDPLTPEVTARLDEILGELNYGAESSGDLSFNPKDGGSIDAADYAMDSSADHSSADLRGEMADGDAEVWDSNDFIM